MKKKTFEAQLVGLARLQTQLQIAHDLIKAQAIAGTGSLDDLLAKLEEDGTPSLDYVEQKARTATHDLAMAIREISNLALQVHTRQAASVFKPSPGIEQYRAGWRLWVRTGAVSECKTAAEKMGFKDAANACEEGVRNSTCADVDALSDHEIVARIIEGTGR